MRYFALLFFCLQFMNTNFAKAEPTTASIYLLDEEPAYVDIDRTSQSEGKRHEETIKISSDHGTLEEDIAAINAFLAQPGNKINFPKSFKNSESNVKEVFAEKRKKIEAEIKDREAKDQIKRLRDIIAKQKNGAINCTDLDKAFDPGAAVESESRITESLTKTYLKNLHDEINREKIKRDHCKPTGREHQHGDPSVPSPLGTV